MSNFEPPYRRFAIRLTKDGHATWWTDDGTGCDDAFDNTEWGCPGLVAYVTRDAAISHQEALRPWARARGLSLAVVLVWEYPGGMYELKRRPKTPPGPDSEKIQMEQMEDD